MKLEANEANEIDYLAIVKLKWPIFHLSATIHLDSDSQPTWKIASLLIFIFQLIPEILIVRQFLWLLQTKMVIIFTNRVPVLTL